MARFRIVPDRSAVEIRATSSVHPITSRTEGVEGFVEVDLDGRGGIDVAAHPKGEVSLAVARLSSGNLLEDRELRRRIDARRFPTIDGRMTEIRPAGPHGRYHVTGDITFRGVTRSYENELTVTVVDDDTIQLQGTATFDIRDFGMEPPRILVLRVHPHVTVTLDAVAVRSERYPI